jgi:hypothetical protein
VSLFACGLSTATNSTPESMSVAMNARLRDEIFAILLCSDQPISIGFIGTASAANEVAVRGRGEKSRRLWRARSVSPVP